ncbi:MAG: dolichyl-phosphate-mannose-protein mannosyltransferase family protein [uncultured bacterium]|nr:MAG: dolichyl-phosphate-mannose-protein mannosyltransferase family protein [uncultured bacterium]
MFLANFGTLQLDHGTYVAWASSLATSGLKHFYSDWSDYLPGYLYILWILGKINLVLPGLQTLTFKLPAILADIATGYLIYKIVGKKRGILFSILYLFNPAIFANSSLWGQVDSLTALFSLFVIYIFPSNYLLSAISLAVGTLIKPQAAFILPAILYLFVVRKKKLYEWITYGITGLTVFILGFLPFSNQSNLFKFILERLTVSSEQYPYGSINAFSFWGLFGFWKPDNIIVWIGLGVSIILIAIVTLIIYKKKILNGQYLVSTISLLITFLFMTRMHERHLLPVLAPLLIATVSNPILFLVYGGLSLTYIANLSYAYYWITDNYKEIFNPVLIKLFIFTNIASFILTIVSIFKKISFNIKFKFNKLSKNIAFKTKDISNKKTHILLIIILLFSLGTRVYALGNPKEMYFDEIYHSFTAKLVLHNDPKAWEFWNPNPEGFAYEWTHPPISKLGMVVGMKVFGENSFGYRVPQAILGTLSVLLIYLLAKEIFKDKLVGILSAFVFSLDGLPLVLSRMGMNDSYVLFFSLLSVYLFIRGKNFGSAFSFGLAIASKWSGIYTFPIILISHFVFRKKLKLSYLSFLVVPIAVYIASYGVMFATGHTWTNFIDTQKQMWWYHTNLVAEHPYTSPAWSWTLLLRPIYLYDGQEVNRLVARIYAFGNPIVFWFGLFSVVLSAIIAYKEKFKRLGFVIFAYLIFFLPWIASPRIMFLYHYLPSIPFLAIVTGFVLRRFPKIINYYFLICFILFLYFYPHWIGMRIPIWLDDSYYWFSSWR